MHLTGAIRSGVTKTAAWPNGKPMMSEAAFAQLIALDWGSTSVRGFLIGGSGQILETRSAMLGASVMTGADDYAAALHRLCADWIELQPELPILACGMVGSKHGWLEVPYALCPGGNRQLGAGIAAVPGCAVHIVPGLLYQPDGSAPDVMRGEETQILGALHLHPALSRLSCLILPGTHSKWAQIQDGQVCSFATHMTGELFAVLRTHSVLGKLMPDQLSEPDLPSFLAGVDAAICEQGLTHALFAVRTLGLTGKLTGAQLQDYLSGLLIGAEIKAGLSWKNDAGLNSAPLALIGEPGICNLYRQALLRFEPTAAMVVDNAAATGLWHLASTAGLINTNQNPNHDYR